MSAITKKAPKLRFPGFSDEWEEKKLGIFIVDSKLSSKTQDEYPVMTSSRSGIVLQKDYYSDNNRITDRDNVGYNILPPNHITYRSRSDDGFFKFNLNNTKNTGIVSYFYPVFSIQDGSNKFFEEYLNQNWKTFYKYSVGTSQKVLAHTELKKIKLLFPTKDEQEKIAGFLGVVDDRISGLQKKVELLRKYKKGIMQKIFSQEIRFKDENGKDFLTWQEKKLGDIALIISGQSPRGSAYNTEGEGLPLYQGKADFGAMFTADPEVWTTETTKVAEPNDVLISVRAPVGPTNFATQKMNIGRGLAAIRAWEGISQWYIFYFLRYIEEQVSSLGGGSTFGSITRKDLSEINVLFPTNGEQQKIADFLTSIDKKIEADERKLEQAKLFKKALLQQMFV